jgi:hypothetical protein
MGVDLSVVFPYSRYTMIHCLSHSECSSNPTDTIDSEEAVPHTFFVTSRLHSQSQEHNSVALMNVWHTPGGIDRQAI